uniref:ATP synthase subunit a n=1 Tax=Pyrocoelia analis TaxID=1453205 RepID=A0A8K1RGF1_9COLE|nr:ATP synthase F0 subunit 6 [Pyrocoelia analis]UEN67845.1 ATP synthase F0 subunit 6 [Pyrocoelia analis]UZG66111.1 ATP synthase F0 subunit 6 [Pyrocoelia analis]
MMSNLFSSFDPSTEPLFSINWASPMLGFMLISLPMWLIPSRINTLWMKLFTILSKEFLNMLKIHEKKNSLLFISLFTLIFFSNFLSLFPYIFPSTSHLTFTFTLALPLWMSFMLFGWINNTTHMFAHLVPLGTPNILMPFMVCIESISNLIRPMTLSVRLSANMIAGHLLLTLMGEMESKMSMMMISTLMLIQLLLLTLESAVAIIQSYVFSILSTLYSSEIN